MTRDRIAELAARLLRWAQSLRVRDILVAPLWLAGAAVGAAAAVVMRMLAAVAVGFDDGIGGTRLPAADTIRGAAGLIVVAVVVTLIVA